MALNSPDGEQDFSERVGQLPAKSAAGSSNNASVTKAITVDVIFAMSERSSSSIFPISVSKMVSLMRYAAKTVSHLRIGAAHSDKQMPESAVKRVDPAGGLISDAMLCDLGRNVPPAECAPDPAIFEWLGRR
jgi:hypothetical protein